MKRLLLPFLILLQAFFLLNARSVLTGDDIFVADSLSVADTMPADSAITDIVPADSSAFDSVSVVDSIPADTSALDSIPVLDSIPAVDSIPTLDSIPVVDSIPENKTAFVGDSIFGIELLNDSNIALLVINTNDAEEPSYERINAPDGLWGNTITNETKVPGKLQLSINGDTYYESGDFVKDSSGMTVKIRGNTSALNAKKPYKIKLQTKADLLGRGNDSLYAHKDWLLIYTNNISMKTLVGFWVNELMGLQWTPACRFVNVVMNGQYRGLYLLTEAVERGKSRLDVEKKSGYILESDAYWWKEDLYVQSNISRYVNYTFKYPDSDKITQEEFLYIEAELAKLMASLDDGTYTEYLDVESFVAWVLAHDLLGTYDSGGSNIYLTKKDSTAQSKFMMGNLWDFDTILKCTDEWGRIHRDPSPFFYPRLFSSSNKTFVRAYIEKWLNTGDAVVDNLINRIDSLKQSPLITSLEHYRPIDYMAQAWWESTLKNILDSYKVWFERRRMWMNEAVLALDFTVGVGNAVSDKPKESDIYDLSGRKVDATYRGIVVRNGRLYLQGH